jgi:hypothetical protein
LFVVKIKRRTTGMTDQEREQIRQKNLLWELAVQTSVQSKEDPVMVFERLLRRYRNQEPISTSGSIIS